MRDAFRADELKHPWLTLLLDAYEAADRGIEADVRARVASGGPGVACKKGCGTCCGLHEIPVYPIELEGISWYVVERMPPELRETVAANLCAADASAACPFLVEGACSIYPVRPIACRQFIVFGKPCEEGEDPFHTRRPDVLTPGEGWRLRAFAKTISFYGTPSKDEFLALMDADEIIQGMARNLRAEDWKRLIAMLKQRSI